MQSEELKRKAIAFDDMSPDESIGAFGGSGQWIELCTVRDLRALEAALSTAEPVMFVSEQQLGCIGQYIPTRKEAEGNFQLALYRAPPAPSVAVKALEWVEGAPGTYTEIAESPFGHYSVWEINGTACWSPWKQGYGSIAEGGLAGAKAAAQADYEARIHAALSAQVQDVAEYERREQVCKETAMSQWERSLKRPDLTEKDRVIGAVEAYKRQAFAFTMLAAAPVKQEA